MTKGAMTDNTPSEETPVEHPPGEYAIVELMGHTTLVGRISEVERFGAKMLALEPLFRDTLLPAIFHGGAAIYRLTPCSADVAFARQPKEAWQIPTAIRCILPPLMLEAVASEDASDEDAACDMGDDDDGPF